jgi:hypothetical protein
MGRRFSGAAVSNVSPPLTVPRFGDQHVTDRAFSQKLHRPADMPGIPGLSADLDNSIVFPSGFDHQPAFTHVVRTRLFDIDVLAGIARQDGRRGMPVIRSRNRNRVHVRVIKNTTDVLHIGRLLPADFLNFGCRLLCSISIGIADPRNPNVVAPGQ